MSKRIRVVLTQTGPAEIRCSPEAVEMVADYAADMVDRLGDEYDFELGVTGGYPVDPYHPRAYARIMPVTEEAEKDNEENNTLLRALRRRRKA